MMMIFFPVFRAMKGFGLRGAGVVVTGKSVGKIHGKNLCIHEGLGVETITGSTLEGGAALFVAFGCGRL